MGLVWTWGAVALFVTYNFILSWKEWFPFFMAFVLAAGDFVVPTMVGGASGGTMIGNLIANQFRGSSADWPLGAALSFVVLALLVIVYLVVTRLLRWGSRL